MKCPACEEELSAPGRECMECGFHIGQLDRRFGAIPLHSVYVTDATYKTLTRWEKRRLENHLIFCERKFPQCRISIFLTHLLPGQDPRLYTFYLFNRGKFWPFEAREGRNFCMLLLLDLREECACLMTGYGLEPHIDEETLLHCLRSGQNQLQKRKYYHGLKQIVQKLRKALHTASRSRNAVAHG